MQFSHSELSDIRIALQDRLRRIQEASAAHQVRNKGERDEMYDEAIARYEAILNRITKEG